MGLPNEMNPNDPTQPKPIQTLPQMRQAQPMNPPMAAPQSNANPTPGTSIMPTPMPPPIAQPQPNFVPPMQQQRPTQPMSNAQTGERSMFSGIGGPAGSRPAPNAPMKPMPAPTGGRPNMNSRRSTPMGG